jgi:DNA polymerase III epsilon subunit-like protein
MACYNNPMNIDTKYTIIIFDTETTGNEAKDRLCQLAYKKFGEKDIFNELYKPPVVISVISQSVHHITPRMVLEKPGFIESPDFDSVKKLFEDENTIVVAHNAKFDIAMLEKEGIVPAQYIDTLKLVRHLDPDMKIERHSLQFLRYLLELDNDIDEPIQAHDAKGDVLILEKLFERLYKKMRELESGDELTLEKMVQISREPSLITRFTFGKYTGSSVHDVAIKDRGYLEWLLKTKQGSEQDEEDWIHTLNHYLNLK